jgi:hypothetical protein
MQSRDSSVGIATGYGLDSRGSIPSRGKIFLFSISSELTLEPALQPIQWVLGVISPMEKRPGREADQSPPSSSEVKNGGAIPPRPICLHGIVNGTLPFLSISLCNKKEPL